MSFRTFGWSASVACLLAANAFTQTSPSITITGTVQQELKLTAEDVAKMPRATLTMMGGGIETVYEGVWLAEILKKAGVPLGVELRGNALTTIILVEASDGYQVVFSLAEVDPDFTDNEVLLADKVNGRPFDSAGSLRIVPPKDTHAARFVRAPVKIEVVQLRK